MPLIGYAIIYPSMKIYLLRRLYKLFFGVVVFSILSLFSTHAVFAAKVTINPSSVTLQENADSQIFTATLTAPIISTGTSTAYVDVNLSVNDSRLQLSTSSLYWDQDNWSQLRTFTVTTVGNPAHNPESSTSSVVWVIDSNAEYYSGASGVVPIHLNPEVVITVTTDNITPQISIPSVSGSRVSPEVLATILTPGPAATAYLASLSAKVSTSTPVILNSAPFSTLALGTRDLKMYMTGADVAVLQHFLNTNGFIVTKTGIGSLGNEGNRFGPSTQAALRRWQVAHGIRPATGNYGPLTRESMGVK